MLHFIFPLTTLFFLFKSKFLIICIYNFTYTDKKEMKNFFLTLPNVKNLGTILQFFFLNFDFYFAFYAKIDERVYLLILMSLI